MSKKSDFCIARSRARAEPLVDQLKFTNFSNGDIPVLFADNETSHGFAHEEHTKAPGGAITRAGAGGVVGGAPGWMASIGGISGALIGMGIPELEAISVRAGAREICSTGESFTPDPDLDTRALYAH